MSKLLILILVSIICLTAYVVVTGKEISWDPPDKAQVKEKVKETTVAQVIVNVGNKRNAYQHKLIETYKRSLEYADHDAATAQPSKE